MSTLPQNQKKKALLHCIVVIMVLKGLSSIVQQFIIYYNRIQANQCKHLYGFEVLICMVYLIMLKFLVIELCVGFSVYWNISEASNVECSLLEMVMCLYCSVSVKCTARYTTKYLYLYYTNLIYCCKVVLLHMIVF